jgi:hypothetical protein
MLSLEETSSLAGRLEISLNEEDIVELKDISAVESTLLKIFSMIIIASMPLSVIARDINKTINAIISG